MWRRVVPEISDTTWRRVARSLRCTTASLQTPTSAPTRAVRPIGAISPLHQQTRDNRAERRMDFALMLAALFCEEATLGGGPYPAERRLRTSPERRGRPVRVSSSPYGGTRN